MNFFTQIDISDTHADTQNLYATVKCNFKLRKLKSDNSFSTIYLFATGSDERVRININLRIATKDWDLQNEQLKSKTLNYQDNNLFLDHIRRQVHDIQVIYRLSKGDLTPNMLKRELKSGVPSADFVQFFKNSLGARAESLNNGSYDRHHSVWCKLKNWREKILFTEIDFKFFNDYKCFYRKKGNKESTLNSNIASIKKWLNVAVKNGIKLRIDLSDLKAGSTRGNRISLTANEIRKLLDFYFSDAIAPNQKLVAGYFLFSCMTGLRISDIQKLLRKNLTDTYVTFVSTKTNLDQNIAINKTARKIVDHYEPLFIKKISDQKINVGLKKIMQKLEIDKNVSFHVARHTFATSFLRAGGSVEKLQLLLGHSTITETMIYVHIIADEANKDIHLLDDYLS